MRRLPEDRPKSGAPSDCPRARASAPGGHGRDAGQDAATWRRLRLQGLVAVLLLSLAAVLPLIPRGCNPYDEGLLATGAALVLRGRTPAVDFYSPYGPGVYYLVAAAFWLFGTRLLVERWVAGILIVTVGALSYTLLVGRALTSSGLTPSGLEAARHRRVGISALAAVLVVLSLLAAWWYPPVTSGAIALLLSSVLLLRRGEATASPRCATLAGLTAGVALIWRLTFGGALLVADAGTWLLTAGYGLTHRRRTARATGLLLLILSAALIALPVYAVLLHSGGRRAVQSLLIWPFSSTRDADLSWPAFAHMPHHVHSPLRMLIALTFGAGFYYWVAALGLLFWRLALGAVPASERRLGLWLLLLFPPFFVYANGRTDYLHVTPLLALSLLLAALVFESGLALRPTAQAQRRWRALGLGVGCAVSLLLAPRLLAGWQHAWNRPGWLPIELPGPRGAGVVTSLYRGTRYRQLLTLLDRWLSPSQTLYSGTHRHDLFLIDDNLVYFLAARDPPTYFWCLDAGVTTSAAVQRQMIREIERSRAGAVAIWTAPRREKHNSGGRSSGVHLLDDWLRREFPGPKLHGPLYEFRLRRWQ